MIASGAGSPRGRLEACPTTCRFHLLLALTWVGLVSGCLAAELPVIPDYQVGDRARADMVTPIPLVVFDPARTESLRRSEAQKTPPVFRYHAAAAQEAEAKLKLAFAETRTRFASDLEGVFNHPLPLLASELEQPSFAEWLQRFRERHPEFPLTAGLAELWALGDSGDVALDGLTAKLRRASGAFVRADRLPPGERLTTGSIRLIAVEQTNAVLTLADVDKRGRNLARTNLVSAQKFHQDALKGVTPAEQAAVKYVTGFLQPNLIYDLELTRQARARRVEAINAADRYTTGQRLIASGETVTARTKLALDELRTRTAADRVQAAATLEQTRAEAQAATARRAAEAARRANRWLFAGLGAVVALLFALTALWFRRRRAVANPSALVSLRDGGGDDLAWRERALAAEARARKATAMLRASLLPHLARWMMNELVQRLLSQRSQVLTGQQKAEREVAELAARLEEVHAPLEDRLRAYEQRIAQLEAELAARGEQSLDLIKAKIETTRKKLEGERSRERLDWN